MGTPAAGHLHRVRHTFLIRQSFLAAPSEYGEAARIDGAGEWRVFWDIYLPLARPALAALGIISFVAWNDYEGR